MNSLQPSAFNLAPPPTLQWQPVQIANFIAVAGRAYPCNTTSAAFTVTLPASPSVGDQVQLLDYAGTWATNSVTVARNGNNINGEAVNAFLAVNRSAVTLTYVDATQGWVGSGAIAATSVPAFSTPSVDYLVVAGGGGGGGGHGGGGGAGGYRTGTGLSVTSGTTYTITVGPGGNGGANGAYPGATGSNSVFSTITSAGGGFGARSDGGSNNGGSGGSGGGGGNGGSGGVGNTPSVSPSQGNTGGNAPSSAPNYGGGGGGGSNLSPAATGGNGTATSGGNGGSGTASTISGSSVTYAGGGGGGTYNGGTAGTGGSGGGGAGANGNPATTGTAGTANTGGGGGGAGYSAVVNGAGGAGGSGIVIISYPDTYRAATTTGSPTVTTSGGNRIYKFTGNGSITF